MICSRLYSAIRLAAISPPATAVAVGLSGTPVRGHMTVILAHIMLVENQLV